MRIRINFSKSESMRYIGHLDLFRSWERTLRRSALPLAYSLGFHPQPRMNLACALPLGFTSVCEIIDVWLENEMPLTRVREAIEAVLPPGLAIHGIDIVDDKAPALQTQVLSAIYEIRLLDEIPDLDDRIRKIISAEHLSRQRHEKPYDLRPLVEELVSIPKDEYGFAGFRVQLAAREAATGRPEELLDEMGIEFKDTHVERVKLIFCN